MYYLEYIWTDADGKVRSKMKVTADADLNKLPIWNFDGSSTGQATGDDSEVLLNPVSFYKNPFFNNTTSYLVVCECLNPDGTPHRDNTRTAAMKVFQKNLHYEPMFGLEQEFFLVAPNQSTSKLLAETKQGPYYCGVGDKVLGRSIVEEVVKHCIEAGLNITGMNAEVAPLQWEIQICDVGIKAADSLITLRYILSRTAEKYGYGVNFDPKPFDGDCNGSGCHVNFSTIFMRSKGGLSSIYTAIKRLEKCHKLHMDNYGKDNNLRMTGEHETCSYDEFKYGVADRGASVRIPRDTEKDGYGYFEDRRPASNMDPYLVTSLIFKTCCDL